MHNLHGSPFYNGTFPKPNTRALPESSTSSIARKGVQRVEDPLAGSRGSAPWVPSINTRKKYAVVTNPIARKGQGRNSLAGSRGSAPWVSPINTRKKCAEVTNSIARKGQGRNSLAGSRGSAPWVSPINTRKKCAEVTNSIARKGQGRNSLAGSRGSAPWVTPPTPSLSASPRPSHCAPPSA